MSLHNMANVKVFIIILQYQVLYHDYNILTNQITV